MHSDILIRKYNVIKFVSQREIRGILCDVWVASRGTQRGFYSTVEVFLSHKNWSVEMEVLNHVQRVPVGVATYLTPAVSTRQLKLNFQRCKFFFNLQQESQLSTEFQHVSTTHYYGYRTGHPAWSNFEIAPCLNRLNRLFLKLSLQSINFSPEKNQSIDVLNFISSNVSRTVPI